MNNKEKLYLVKLAQSFQGFTEPSDRGEHAPGSVGAAFQPNNVDYYGGGGPAIGSRAFRELPQAQRQGLINARDEDQFLGDLSNSLDQPHPKFRTYNNLPTAKGGLQDIPVRPAAHPLSKQTRGLPDPEGAKNTQERMDRGMPVQKHNPYERKGPASSYPTIHARNG